jgi:uncharacterized membrane protein
MMWGYGFDAGTWVWMGLMMLFPLLVLIGIVLLIIWAVRHGTRGGREEYAHRRDDRYGRGDEDEALAIARRRYANGEISAEEYDELVQVLRR